MPSGAIQIDPALLAWGSSTSHRTSSLLTPTAPAIPPAHVPSPTDTQPPTSRIGVAHGASTIGVGYASSSTPPYHSLSDMATPSEPVSVLSNMAIDPALFQLEEVVKSVRAAAKARTTSGSETGAPELPARTGSAKRQRVALPPVQAADPPSAFVPESLASMAGPLESEIDPALQNEGQGVVDDTGTGLGEEFDPQIREIVQRLTKAQEDQLHDQHAEDAIMNAQTDAALTEALTDEQTVAAISAHLVAAEGMDQHIQNSLANMTSDHLNSFFHQSPSAQNYLLSDYTDAQPHSTSSLQVPLGQSDLDVRISSALQAESFSQSSPHASSSAPHIEFFVPPSESDTDPLAGGVKRKRGRPKGSKNKPKPYTGTPPPTSPKAAKARPKSEGPPKRIGRPPKERTGAELEEYLKRQAENAAGVKRPRGRPRKFPGYLVRNMRLKANREEFREVVRRYAEDGGTAGSASGSQAGGEGWPEASGSQGGTTSEKGEYRELEMGEGAGSGGDDRAEEEEEYDWANDPQNLIDAVSGQIGEAGTGMGLGMKGMGDGLGRDMQRRHQEGEEGHDDEPSADTGLGREGMGHVFGLEEA